MRKVLNGLSDGEDDLFVYHESMVRFIMQEDGLCILIKKKISPRGSLYVLIWNRDAFNEKLILVFSLIDFILCIKLSGKGTEKG